MIERASEQRQQNKTKKEITVECKMSVFNSLLTAFRFDSAQHNRDRPTPVRIGENHNNQTTSMQIATENYLRIILTAMKESFFTPASDANTVDSCCVNKTDSLRHTHMARYIWIISKLFGCASSRNSTENPLNFKIDFDVYIFCHCTRCSNSLRGFILG